MGQRTFKKVWIYISDADKVVNIKFLFVSFILHALHALHGEKTVFPILKPEVAK